MVGGPSTWDFITGFMDSATPAEDQVLQTLFKEIGLEAKDLEGLRRGEDLLVSTDNQAYWLMHTFVVDVLRQRLNVSSSYESCRWTTVDKSKRFFNRSEWFDEVLRTTHALGSNDQSASPKSIHATRSEPVEWSSQFF